MYGFNFIYHMKYSLLKWNEVYNGINNVSAITIAFYISAPIARAEDETKTAKFWYGPS